MSQVLETLAPSRTNPSAAKESKEWTVQEEAAFDEIIERLKHVRDEHPEDTLILNARRAIQRALDNFGTRRGLMIPFLQRANAINRILGLCRHRLLGPKRQT